MLEKLKRQNRFSVLEEAIATHATPIENETTAVPSLATEKVLSTTELLENILLHCTIRDLLINALRVSKQWKSTIDKSIHLQRALFFEPLSYEPLRLFNSTKIPGARFWARNTTDPYAYSVLKNPFVDKYINVARYLRKSSMQTAEASWRRMMPAQPGLYPATLYPVREYGIEDRLGEIIKLRERTFIDGACMWMPVEYANEVQVVRRPKVIWL